MKRATITAPSRRWSVSARAAAKAAGLALLASAPLANAADGKVAFESACGACHKKDGTGVAGLAPPLANADWAKSADPAMRTYLPLVVLNGISGKIVAGGKTFMSAMPPQKQRSDEELAAIAAYVVGTLNPPPAGWTDYTTAEMAALRAEKADRKALLELRGKLVE
ncbi:MAG: cytochrome c [Mesorhizobium sp.]